MKLCKGRRENELRQADLRFDSFFRQIFADCTQGDFRGDLRKLVKPLE